jgi:hypothetical protein
MRLLFRRIFVVLIALGFVAGGYGRTVFAMTGTEPCHPKAEMAEQYIHEHGDTHATHDPAAYHSHEQGGDSGKTAEECFKCCGICTASPQLTTTNPSGGARLVGYRVAYFVFTESWADRPFVIDPGIPKRIA